MTPTREQIEASAFNAYEIQKLAFAKHGVTLNNPFYEDMYTAGFEAGAKYILEQMQAQKEQWQREAWEAAREREAAYYDVTEQVYKHETIDDWWGRKRNE